MHFNSRRRQGNLLFLFLKKMRENLSFSDWLFRGTFYLSCCACVAGAERTTCPAWSHFLHLSCRLVGYSTLSCCCYIVQRPWHWDQEPVFLQAESHLHIVVIQCSLVPVGSRVISRAALVCMNLQRNNQTNLTVEILIRKKSK